MAEPTRTRGTDTEEEDVEDKFVPPARRLVLPENVVKLEPDMDFLEIIGTQGLKLTKMKGLEAAPKLERLTLRSSFIRKIRALETLTRLVYLELYENRIRFISGLDTLVNLQTLDLSYNRISKIEGLESLVNLDTLYIASNRVEAISGLRALASLRRLDLGMNRIRKMEELECCTSLTELWLGKNKISRIEGIEALVNLKRLDVQSNRLVSIDGLEKCVQLEELYLSHNGLKSLEGLPATVTALNTIDVGANEIDSVVPAHLGHLTALEELWMNDNKIPTFAVLEALAPLTTLQTVYLERNPVASEFEYRIKLKDAVPSLKQIDATMVRLRDRPVVIIE